MFKPRFWESYRPIVNTPNARCAACRVEPCGDDCPLRWNNSRHGLWGLHHLIPDIQWFQSFFLVLFMSRFLNIVFVSSNIFMPTTFIRSIAPSMNSSTSDFGTNLRLHDPLVFCWGMSDYERFAIFQSILPRTKQIFWLTLSHICGSLSLFILIILTRLSINKIAIYNFGIWLLFLKVRTRLKCGINTATKAYNVSLE